MKKLVSIALSLLMLISCFALCVSAKGVNVASKGTYIYEAEPAFKTDSSMADDTLNLLIDGVNPTSETPFETVAFTGTGAVVTVIFDLGALYSDITDINFLSVCDSQTVNGGNRGFSKEKTMFYISEDGVNFERNKDVKMTGTAIEEGSIYFNFGFKFGSNVKARYIKVIMYSPVYILSLGEIEIISASGEGSAPVAPPVVESEEPAVSTEEPAVSTDEPVASTDESAASTDESAVSTEESAAVSADTSKEESKADTSKETSKETSKNPTSSTDNNDDKDGISPVVIIIIIVAVIAVAVVVVIIIKRR